MNIASIVTRLMPALMSGNKEKITAAVVKALPSLVAGLKDEDIQNIAADIKNWVIDQALVKGKDMQYRLVIMPLADNSDISLTIYLCDTALGTNEPVKRIVFKKITAEEIKILAEKISKNVK